MRYISRHGFASDEAHATYDRVSGRLLPFLLLLYVVAFLDRVNVSFAKLGMAKAIGLGDAAYGFGAGIFFIGFCIFEIPSNLLLQRVGARLWIARIMVTWGIVSAATAWVSTPWEFYVARFLLGICEAGFYPGIILYLSYWYPRQARGQATAIFVVGIALAGVFGSPFCGFIMGAMGAVPPLANWQWLFVLTGVPAVILGIATYLYLDDRPSEAAWLPQADRDRIARDLAAEEGEMARAGAGHRLSEAFSDGRVWCLAGVNFSIVVCLYGVSFWLPQIVKNLGVVDTFHNGLIVAIPSFLAAVAMVLVARHSDRTGERRWHTAACSLVSTVGLLIAAMAIDQPVLALTGLSMATVGVLTAFAILWTIPGLLVSGTAAAAAIALITTVGNLGGYVGPFLVGWVKEMSGSFGFPLYVFAALSFAGALALAALPGISRPRSTGPLPALEPESLLNG